MEHFFLGSISDLVVALIVLASGIWFILNWRRNRRKEEALTKKAEAETVNVESRNKELYNKALADTNKEWQKLYETQNERINGLEQKIQDMESKHAQEMQDLKLQIEKLKNERRILYRIIDKAYKCPVIKKIEECVVINEAEKMPRKEDMLPFKEDV